jgi:alkaline phosphatase D
MIEDGMNNDRRKLIKFTSILAGTYVFDAATGTLSAQVLNETTASVQADRFPQGVASADPQPNAVLLWTRALPGEGADTVDLTLQVALSDDFTMLVLERNLQATEASDYTVRALVSSLDTDTTYYYRFITSDGASSRTGRTWTAPDPADERPVSIAFLCCNSLQNGFFGSYRRLMNDETDSAGRSDIAFVLHLGDYIYENVRQEEPDPPSYEDGTLRRVMPFSSGGLDGPRGTRLASTLDDYRLLYREYLQDPDLQEMRARYPFVQVWDDHEFADDAWQSFAGDGPKTARKMLANQAWFEYVPAILSESRAVEGSENQAQDFRISTVSDAPLEPFDENFLSAEPNNKTVTDSITIFRSLRWGAHMEMLVTDQRSYRSPAGTLELGTSFLGDGEATLNPDRGLPYSAVNLLAAGKTANNGNPPETVTINGRTVPNPRRNSPAVTMLGAEQKNWLKESLAGSNATWKVWGSPLPVQQFNVDYSAIDPAIENAVLWPGDNWDGFPNERKELMQFVKDSGITNLISLSGDRHIHAVSLVAEDYMAAEPSYVMPDFAVTAVSMVSRNETQTQIFNALDLPELNIYRRPGTDGSPEARPNLNVVFRHGTRAAQVMADTDDINQAAAVSSNPNPAMKMIDTRVIGYGVAHFNKDDAQVDLVALDIETKNRHYGDEGPPLKYRASFRVPAWQAGAEPEILRTGHQGDPVFGEVDD